MSSLIVLMFHGVVPDVPEYSVYPGTRTCLIRARDFEACIRWCAANYRFLSLRDLPRYLRGDVAEPGVLVTFDDGLASVIDHAVPVLRKYGATGVQFVTTEWVDGQKTPAIFRLERDLWETPPAILSVTVGDAEFTAAVGTRSRVRAALSGLWDFCFDRRVAPLSLGTERVRFDGRTWEPDPSRQERHVWFPASWDELATVSREGVLEIGSHGVSHTPWSFLSEGGRRREIGESRDRLRALTGSDVRACSYPHGMHDAAAAAAAREVYDWAFTTGARPVKGDAVEALPRFHVPGERPVIMDLIVRRPLVGRVVRKISSLAGRD